MKPSLWETSVACLSTGQGTRYAVCAGILRAVEDYDYFRLFPLVLTCALGLTCTCWKGKERDIIHDRNTLDSDGFCSCSPFFRCLRP